MAFTSCNSPAETKAVVAELASASPGARRVARGEEVRHSFNVTPAVESVIDTPRGLEAATADTGITRAAMAARLNNAAPSAAIDADLTGQITIIFGKGRARSLAY